MNINRVSPCVANLKLGFFRGFTVKVSEQQKQNHYDSLGVTPKATQGDIKSAYYKLSKEYHPDMNKGNEDAAEKFRNITAAYEVLGNVKSRKIYDRGLLVGLHNQEYGQAEEQVVDTYPHAPFYHHRNKPTSQKTKTGNTTNYNIDEWTRAHYSETFEKQTRRKSEGKFYKARVDNLEKDVWRNLPTLSLFIILLTCLLMFQTDSKRRFDRSSIPEKPD